MNTNTSTTTRIVTNQKNKQITHKYYSNSNLKPLSEKIQLELQKFPSVITIPVQWGFQDSYNHLNNVNWLRYSESAQIDYVTLLSLHMDKKENQNLIRGITKGKGFVVKSIEMKYILPVAYPDALTIATHTQHLEKDRFLLNSKFYSHAHNRLAAESFVLCVGYDFAILNKADFSDSLYNAIVKLEKDPVDAQRKALELPCRMLANL